MTPAILTIAGLGKRYGDVVALAPTDLEVARGEFLTLLGPSGSGKTTLLSLIAGLSAPDSGRLLIDGRDLTDGAPYERDLGMVFQNYALFPHMTVAENIAFPLKMRKVDAAEAKRQAQAALDLVRLPQVAQRYPKELSGGQQQRIALARCLVYRPSIVLMDEPLGALDKKLRDQMQLEIRRIHRELGTTIVYVTHDQEEAMTMSDRICLMNHGRIEQLGTPADLYFRPRNLFVADFLGESNLLEGIVERLDGDEAEVRLAHGAGLARARWHEPVAAGARVRLMVRPQNVAVAGQAAGEAVNTLAGTVLDSTITGSLTRLYVACTAAGAVPVVACHATSGRAADHPRGATVALQWHSRDAVVLPEGA
ncbi:MAG: ABC transporter ATP-binding protein [Rubrivivax sp.]|nr:ABC transporter ATP-binding protein [Rubrivivax sp.]